MSGMHITTRRAVVLGFVLALALLAGCRTASGPRSLPNNLPDNPDPRTTYCRVWVPPVYRDVPQVVMCEAAGTVTRTETVSRTRVEEVLVKPRETKICRTPDLRCEQAVVQTTPGGYRWKQTPDGCWKYVNEPPSYKWCNKVVTKKGIEYCAEIPPEYKTVAWTEPVEVCRQEYKPAKYKVAWRKEVYTPGYWAWQPRQDACEGECPPAAAPPPVGNRPCARLAGVPSTN